MTTFRIQEPTSDSRQRSPSLGGDGTDATAVLAVVREDIRQTLRMGWIDPTLDSLAAHPLFFTAAWSAMRPNVGKSFQALARTLRAQAADVVRSNPNVPDLRKRLEDSLSEEELTRIEGCVKAAHLASVKVQIVVHAYYRAIRRDHVRSTGREEPPVRRGIPDWQRWMAFQPAPPEAQPILDEAGRAFDPAGAPSGLRLLARWPAALAGAWTELRRHRATDAWRTGAARIRRAVLGGLHTLPHPIELQWTALRARGFVDANRNEVAKLLAAHDAIMPWQSLAAAFLWSAFGAPEIGPEG
jgi:hypothetical protein